MPLPRPTPAFLLGAAVALLPDESAAQGRVPVVPLPTATATLEESFDRVGDVRELADGRVLVLDQLAKRVVLADFARNTARAVGREGAGPNEYRFPRTLLAMPGDTTYVVDPMQSRFLRVAPDGAPAGTVAFPAAMGGIPRIKGADAQGRIYFQGSPFRAAPGGGAAFGGEMTPLDSVPVLRYDPRTKRVDTLGLVKGPEMSVRTGGTASNRSIMMTQQPFRAQDDWAVAPSGAVALARAGSYRVDWVDARGRVVAGTPVTWTPVKVSQADKDELLRRQSDPRNRMVVTRGGGGAGPRPPQVATPQLEFPEAKPPFVENTARVALDGTLWLRRSTAHGAAPLYDVFDARGTLVRQVSLPKGGSVVGFGKGTVYVLTLDEDELGTLSRHPMP